MIRITLTAALIALSLPSDAQELQQCGDPKQFAAELESRWGETRAGIGFMPNGNSVVLFTDATGDTWTIMVITRDGKDGCIVATGTNWKSMGEI